MMKRLTILIAALSLSLAGSASWACPGGACSGKAEKTAATATDPSVKTASAADHNTQPLGGADEAAAAEGKTAASCGAKTAASEAESSGCCGKAAASEKTADAAKSATNCPKDMANCPKDKANCAKEGCAEKTAAECPYMKGLEDKPGVTAEANEANPKVAPGGGETTNQPKSAPADAPEAKDTPKTAYKVGSKVEPFAATDSKTGESVSLAGLEGKKATALIFWNQQCPFVQEAEGRIAEFQKSYQDKGVNVVAIDAGVNNDPESVKKYAEDKPFAILLNRDSTLAAQFGATHTPEVFLLDPNGVIQYHGAFDSGKLRSGQTERKNYVVDAVTAVLKGEKPAEMETRAFGCSLKYAEGVKPLE